MNYPALLVYTAICLLVIWLILAPLQKSDGFDQFLINGKKGYDHKPVICFIKDNVNPNKHTVIKALKQWELALEKYTDTKLYDYTIRQVETEMYNCDAVFQAGDPTKLIGNETPVGGTLCWEDAKLSQFGQIYLKDRYCRFVANPDYDNGQYYYDTIVHELGHVLGLGHRVPIKVEGFAGVFMAKDMMFPFADKGVKITHESLDALQTYYGYNGYNSFQNIENYTIPHD